MKIKSDAALIGIFFLSTSFKRMQNAIHQAGGKKLSILHEMCYQASLSDSLHLSR